MVVRSGVNLVDLDVDFSASPDDGTLQCVQDVVYKISSSPAPLDLFLRGSALPMRSAGGTNPVDEPPFKLAYDFTLPTGGAGNESALIMCEDDPITQVQVHGIIGVLTGDCSVAIRMVVWLHNPTSLPVIVECVFLGTVESGGVSSDIAHIRFTQIVSLYAAL